jgi:hypothetical protein
MLIKTLGGGSFEGFNLSLFAKNKLTIEDSKEHINVSILCLHITPLLFKINIKLNDVGFENP